MILNNRKNKVNMELMLGAVFMRSYRHGAKFMVVLIGLVIIFKSQLTDLVQSIFDKITSESGRI